MSAFLSLFPYCLAVQADHSVHVITGSSRRAAGAAAGSTKAKASSMPTRKRSRNSQQSSAYTEHEDDEEDQPAITTQTEPNAAQEDADEADSGHTRCVCGINGPSPSLHYLYAFVLMGRS